MTGPVGTLPVPWHSATRSDLRTVSQCQSARTLPTRARTRAGRPPELALCHSAQVEALLILALCLALCPSAGTLPRSAGLVVYSASRTESAA
jgi:hypothetical protein